MEQDPLESMLALGAMMRKCCRPKSSQPSLSIPGTETFGGGCYQFNRMSDYLKGPRMRKGLFALAAAGLPATGSMAACGADSGADAGSNGGSSQRGSTGNR